MTKCSKVETTVVCNRSEGTYSLHSVVTINIYPTRNHAAVLVCAEHPDATHPTTATTSTIPPTITPSDRATSVRVPTAPNGTALSAPTAAVRGTLVPVFTSQNPRRAVTPSKKNRAGSPNCTKEEMLRLCEIVAEVLPLGSNEWAVVAAQYEEGRTQDDTFRDQDSLRKKFEKLAAHKKSNGDASCPEEVRSAKSAARYIVGRESAGEVDESSSEY